MPMYQQIIFLNVARPGRPLYLNPILSQSLAGAVREALPETRVDILDGAAGDPWARLLEHLDEDYLIVLSLMAGDDLDDFLTVAANSASPTGPIVLIGALVTDAPAETVLSRVAPVVSGPVYAFVGREPDRFIQLVKSIVSSPSMPELPELPNVVSLSRTQNEKEWATLPVVTDSPRLLFTDTIVRAIDERGIAVLMEGLTRGCEYHCNYCHLNFNRQTRGLVQNIAGDSAQRIIDVHLQIPGNSFIFFTDENFFGGKDATGKDRLETIIRLSQELSQYNFNRELAVDTRIDSLYSPRENSEESQLRRRAWESFKAIGLKYAYLGVESFSESQLRRYAKSSEYQAIDPGIALARELDLSFTLGMIIMDPLVTPQEIRETLNFIDRLDLYSHVASLFKPLRLGVKSPYAGWAAKKLPQTRLKAFPGGVEIFQDEKIREIWPVIHRIHSMFTDSGYRHSDVAVFDSVFGAVSSEVNRIPAIVSRMECEVLRGLLDSSASDQAIQSTARLVEGAVAECHGWIANNCITASSSIQGKVGQYYKIVFDAINSKLARRPWLKEALIHEQ